MCCRCLRLEVGNVDGLTFLRPLHERPETAGGNHDALLLSGCGVHNDALLQIRHLAALRLDVTVAHVVTREWRFASDGADFRHMR